MPSDLGRDEHGAQPPVTAGRLAPGAGAGGADLVTIVGRDLGVVDAVLFTLDRVVSAMIS